MENQVLRVPRQTSRLPHICPCCLTTPDSELILHNTKTYPLIIATVQQTTSVTVPCCSPCVRHVLWHQDGGMVGALLHASLVFVLVGGILGIPAGFIWLGAWLRAGDSGTEVVLPTSFFVAAGLAAALGLVVASLSLRRRLRFRPGDVVDARHAHPSKPLILAASSPTDYYFAVHNPLYAREVLAQVPSAEVAAPAELSEERKLSLLQLLLLLMGLAGVILVIKEAWDKLGH